MSVDLKPKTLKRKNFKKLSLNADAGVAPQAAAPQPPSQPFTLDKPTLQRAPSAGNLISQMASLELGVEFKIDIRAQDLRTIQELGAGNGGSVSRVEHIPTGAVMAKKVIHIEAKEAVRRQILRELHIMHECDSPYIVSFYGAFINESSGDVVMCMEFMDCGSLDRIYKKAGPLTEEIVGHITVAVVEGLTYLYNEHRIVHRDVKPSNILVNSHGQIKLCDFGVSGELINSIADTFVGTSTYMSPERIQGGNYTVKSDVWSLGISLLELLLGRFPFDVANGAVGPMGILDLLQRIVNEPPPTLPAEDTHFSPVCRRFVDRCLYKEAERPSPQQLINDAFIITSRAKQVDMKAWAMSVQ